MCPRFGLSYKSTQDEHDWWNYFMQRFLHWGLKESMLHKIFDFDNFAFLLSWLFNDVVMSRKKRIVEWWFLFCYFFGLAFFNWSKFDGQDVSRRQLIISVIRASEKQQISNEHSFCIKNVKKCRYRRVMKPFCMQKRGKDDWNESLVHDTWLKWCYCYIIDYLY